MIAVASVRVVIVDMKPIVIKIVMVTVLEMHLMMFVIYVQKEIVDMRQIVIYYIIVVIQIMMDLEILIQCYMPVKPLLTILPTVVI